MGAHFPSTWDDVVIDMKQGAYVMNAHMINIGRITFKDTVLDLGCGKGHGPVQIAQQTGATVVGVDIGTENIIRAKEFAAQHPDLKLTYAEGSFTDIPKEIKNIKYSVVFAQLAFCHVHAELPAILEEVKAVMAPGGRLVIMDYLGCDGKQSEATKENVMKRLHFDVLHGHKAWRRICEDSGFYIQYYENLDAHMAQSYKDLAKGAYEHGFVSADGAKLGDNYSQTVKAVEAGEIGMNFAVLTLERRSKL